MISRKADFFLLRGFDLLTNHSVQKESGTGMATWCPLATFISWLRVVQLQSPEEQLSW